MLSVPVPETATRFNVISPVTYLIPAFKTSPSTCLLVFEATPVVVSPSA